MLGYRTSILLVSACLFVGCAGTYSLPTSDKIVRIRIKLRRDLDEIFLSPKATQSLVQWINAGESVRTFDPVRSLNCYVIFETHDSEIQLPCSAVKRPDDGTYFGEVNLKVDDRMLVVDTSKLRSAIESFSVPGESKVTGAEQ